MAAILMCSLETTILNEASIFQVRDFYSLRLIYNWHDYFSNLSELPNDCYDNEKCMKCLINFIYTA